jgi:hypothetical protein
MARRGFKFTVAEIEHLLETIEDVIPIGNPDWERIWQEHSARYPTKERTSESLKRKFQELARKKIPTGDPNCPPYVRKYARAEGVTLPPSEDLCPSGGSNSPAVGARNLTQFGEKGKNASET